MLSSSEGTRKSVFKETVKSCVEYIFLILFYSGVLLVFLAYSEILMYIFIFFTFFCYNLYINVCL